MVKEYFIEATNGKMNFVDAIIELTNILENPEIMKSLTPGERNIYYDQEWQIDDYLIKTYGDNIGSYMEKHGYSPSYRIENGNVIHFWIKCEEANQQM